ncbi:protein of unknown function [Roseovarius nanhaiticus]|uniref:DUF4174 domain-containing protein n=1 Tax=Roseovarius nanhaiticus TaxID=573024 RepID=A0A1N7HDP0_9RHOB|nr:DUF4174 domain-containing protein [Roseovarius nanhaiticus]SEL00774.1 protein of unknown function [Roseovarius nanhaiticus]SIS22985.1 protein of unknown function [Roseovarius nanhaiticus]
MKLIPTLVFAGLLAAPLSAQTAPAIDDVPAPDSIVIEGTDVDLKQFRWKKRPLVVFADSPNDPQFIRQMELLTNELPRLIERDVVILTDTDPEGDSALRQQLRPRGFMLALIVKDGTIYLRKPVPWDVREITRTIDKLPMREREIEERRGLPD